MDTRRIILWVVFSLSILILWDNWLRYTGQPSMFGLESKQAQQQATSSAPQNANEADIPQATTKPPSPAAVPVAPQQPAGELVNITTDLMNVQVNTLGGEITRLELRKHEETEAEGKQNIVLFQSNAAQTYVAQTGLIGGTFPNHRTPFTVQAGPRTLDNGDQLQLVMTAEQGGVRLTKTYTFHRDSYVIDVRHDVANISNAPVAPASYMQLLRDGAPAGEDSMFYSTFTGPAVYTDAQKFQKVDFEAIDEGSAEHATQASDGWIAMVQHYFVAAFLPPADVQREIYTRKVGNNLYAVGAIVPMGTLAPGAQQSMTTQLYAGPQETDRLNAFAPGFDLVKDYGWLTMFAKPLFWVMETIHDVLGNWGWTIVAVTILIKLVFFPLSAASYRSMAKMRKVTPKLTAIRERYKDKPQEMNKAMMELYKTEKINPVGGCLPILIQIPVFIALYWVLLASVEMRNAPWIGWIQDLSAPDPWFILPVIMAVSMYIQVKLNPTPPDPMQAKIMMFMPIAFSVMFFFFPAGLVLYWVVNNILSIAQQWVITKRIEEGKPA
jgi:YidC/Oxa1 family membrane protein insertase